MLQLDRIAQSRGFNSGEKTALQKLVVRFTEGHQWGLFGEARVNVLQLNLALDEL
jgi:K+-transporting ATPase ATPase C chain